jgi:dinuclear metal center YbgI/SA1388 family protein
MTPTLASIVDHLDALLRTAEFPDYPGALNGLQLANRSPVRRVAAAVDCSRRVIEAAVACEANLLLVHHGMFWGGAQRLVGPRYERLRLLMDHDIAVYSSHLPLDAHPTLGNNALLARTLGLEPTRGFAREQSILIGVAGDTDLPTTELVVRADAFARPHGGRTHATVFDAARRTRRWAICTGAGASSTTIREAVDDEIDTLIVGEGPHHTAVDAPEHGLVIIYAGHYATETLGVTALAKLVGEQFGLAWSFIDAPTGL